MNHRLTLGWWKWLEKTITKEWHGCHSKSSSKIKHALATGDSPPYYIFYYPPYQMVMCSSMVGPKLFFFMAAQNFVAFISSYPQKRSSLWRRRHSFISMNRFRSISPSNKIFFFFSLQRPSLKISWGKRFILLITERS